MTDSAGPPAAESVAPRRSPVSVRRLRAGDAVALAAVCVLAFAAAIWFAVLGVQVHRALHTSAYDLGFFDQILWNTAHGRWFATTYTPHSYNFLGQHAEWALLPFAGLYRLFDAGAETLIEAQALAAGLAIVPLYLVARRHAPALPSALLCLAFLLAPQLERGVDFGFHPELALPLLAFSAYAAHLYRRPAVFVALCLAMLLVKEDAFLVVLALAALAAIDGRRRLGGPLALIAVVYATLTLLVVMPHMRGPYVSDLAERYGYLGTTPPAIVKGALLHPDRAITHLSKWSIVATVVGLLLVTGFLPLFAPEALLLAVPPALVGLLATHPEQQALDLQYAAPVLAILFIAAARGLARLSARPLTLNAFRWGAGEGSRPCTGLPNPASPSARLSLPLRGREWIFRGVGGLSPLAAIPLPRWGRDRFCSAKPGLGSPVRSSIPAPAPGLSPLAGGKRLGDSGRARATLPLALAVCALLLATLGYMRRGPYPGGGAYAAWRFRDDGDGAALTRVARLIPIDAAVSAQTGLLTHLSQRRTAWEFPRLEGAPYVVVEDYGIVSQQSKQTYGGYDAVRARLPALGYVEIAHDHGIQLYHLAGAAQ